jgi:hypothetical protein
MRLPGGDAAITPQAYEKLHWIMLHTTPGQFFFQADWPGMYLPLKLRNPTFVDAISPGEETRPEDIASVIQQLEGKRVQYVLWRARLDSAESSKDHLLPLRTYLHLKYTQVHAFADGDTVWERNESSATLVDPSLDSHGVSCGHGNEKTAQRMKRSYSGQHHREDGPLFISAESLDSIVSAGV